MLGKGVEVIYFLEGGDRERGLEIETGRGLRKSDLWVFQSSTGSGQFLSTASPILTLGVCAHDKAPSMSSAHLHKCTVGLRTTLREGVARIFQRATGFANLLPPDVVYFLENLIRVLGGFEIGHLGWPQKSGSSMLPSNNQACVSCRYHMAWMISKSSPSMVPSQLRSNLKISPNGVSVS